MSLLSCIWTSVFCLIALSLIKRTSDIRRAETAPIDGEDAPPSAAAFRALHFIFVQQQRIKAGSFAGLYEVGGTGTSKLFDLMA